MTDSPLFSHSNNILYRVKASICGEIFRLHCKKHVDFPVALYLHETEKMTTFNFPIKIQNIFSPNQIRFTFSPAILSADLESNGRQSHLSYTLLE